MAVTQTPPAEVVVLGASNVTRLLPVIDATLRATFGPVRLFAAHGHGRSYGIETTFLGRRLDGHVHSALWDDLEANLHPAARRYALVTDVGNDLIYPPTVPDILGWAGECVSRLTALGFETSVTLPPVDPVVSLAPLRYEATARLFFPKHRVPFERVVEDVRALDAGLRAMAAERGLGLAEPKAAWFKIDPIHVRFLCRREAMTSYLGQWPTAPPVVPSRAGVREAARIWRSPPKRMWVAGVEKTAEQPTVREDGRELWLY